MKKWLGIDPGQTGALVVLYEDNSMDFFDWPGDPSIAATNLKAYVADGKFVMAVLEKVNAMPGQGVSSMFKFGMNYGIWQGLLAAFQIPYDLVTPQKWQKGIYKAEDGDKKNRSLSVVRRLYPHLSENFKRKKDHGRADAFLMARHAKLNY